MRVIPAALFLCLVLAIPAEAKPSAVYPVSCGAEGLGCVYASERKSVRTARVKRTRVAQVRTARRTITTYARRPVQASKSLAGVVAPLAAKVQEIQSACGSYIVSAVRYTRVRGSGRISLHASGRAVDIAGNPKCIYAHLHGWRGGYSTDYHRIRPNHVHISLGGSEDGKRFTHWQPRRVRLAHAR